jgi:hypothetical protein
MKIYTIAEETHECYGHGDYGTELRICKQGGYGTGNFPPLFKTKEKAQEYIKNLKYSTIQKVVEMDLIE